MQPDDSNNTLILENDGCGFLDTNYDITTSIVCALHFFFGIIYSLFGYRCFNAVMFLTGFIFASIIIYLVCLEEDLMTSYGNTSAALGTGLLFGLITMLVHYVGLFVMGLQSGLLLGVVILTVLQQQYVITNMWITVGVLFGSALVMAVMTLTFQKAFTIFGTALYGGAVLAGALDYYVEKFTMVLWMWDRVKLEEITDLCWVSWLLLSVWPFMLVVGIITQAFITARDFFHDYQGRTRRRRPVTAPRRPNVEHDTVPPCPPRGPPRRYRYVYQVRTAHGDVISQRYIQALRKMVPNVTKPSALQSAYAMCDGESDTDMINGGTWSTIATTQDSAQQRFK